MKKIFILFIIIAAAVVVLFLIFGRQSIFKQQNGPVITPRPTPLPSVYRGVIPGTSTVEEVVGSLGAPIRRDIYKNTSTLVYPSGLGNQPINVGVGLDNTIFLITEPVAPTVRFTQLVGTDTADLILYGLFEDEGFRLFIYLNKGVAFLANPTTQIVKEKWYFHPTNAAVFQETIAPSLSITSTEGQQ